MDSTGNGGGLGLFEEDEDEDEEFTDLSGFIVQDESDVELSERKGTVKRKDTENERKGRARLPSSRKTVAERRNSELSGDASLDEDEKRDPSPSPRRRDVVDLISPLKLEPTIGADQQPVPPKRAQQEGQHQDDQGFNDNDLFATLS